MTNPIRKIMMFFVVTGFLSCANTPKNEEANDVGPDSDVNNETCFGPMSPEACGRRGPECTYTQGTVLVVDKANNCSNETTEGYCVLWGEPTANSSSNVFYKETNGDYEYLRISPYIPYLTGSNWIPCEVDLSTSPAPGCNSCEDDRP